MLEEFQCVERSQPDASDDAPPADDASPAPTTLSIPPLNLLASMQDSSDEEGARGRRSSIGSGS